MLIVVFVELHSDCKLTNKKHSDENKINDINFGHSMIPSDNSTANSSIF